MCSTLYCLTRLPLNFEKILHSGRNALVQVHQNIIKSGKLLIPNKTSLADTTPANSERPSKEQSLQHLNCFGHYTHCCQGFCTVPDQSWTVPPTPFANDFMYIQSLTQQIRSLT